MGEATFETARGKDRWQLPTYTVDQVRALPAVVPMVDAARAWGLSEAQAYRLAREGQLPFRVLRIGRSPTGGGKALGNYQVRRADLLESLGIEDVPSGGPPRTGDPAA